MTELMAPEFLGTLQAEALTMAQLREWKRRVSSNPVDRKILVAYVQAEAEATSRLRSPEKVNEMCLVVGALQWVLARFEEAAGNLERVKRNDFARQLEGDCYLELEQYDKAEQVFSKLVGKVETLEVQMGLVESLIGKGAIDEAAKVLKSASGKYGNQAEWHYQSGMLADARGEKDLAVAAYQKALELDAKHARALFRLASHCDLAGDNEEALALYERCAEIPPVRVNALLNLGLLYEDTDRYEDAINCFKRVLRSNPNHERAKLYLKDAQNSLTMYYDEEQERQTDRRNKVLEIPVTDFELSVRARNCLERMNVKSLGDLTRITEQELLSYKNFGETSLNEVKQMMSSKGLRLGQALEKEAARPKRARARVATASDPRNMAVADLELSVRSRKCLTILGIQTLGDLVGCSEEQLLASKNFGLTSLSEIKQKLAEFNLGLRQD